MIEVSVRACTERIHGKEVAAFILDVLKQFVVLGQCGLSLRTVLAGVRSGASAARRTACLWASILGVFRGDRTSRSLFSWACHEPVSTCSSSSESGTWMSNMMSHHLMNCL